MTSHGVTPIIGTRSSGPEYGMFEKCVAEAILYAEGLMRRARPEEERIFLRDELRILEGVAERVRAAIAGRAAQETGGIKTGGQL